MLFKNFLIAGLGGMLGTMLRYAAYLLLKNQPFPYSTLLVNIAGSFIIGIVAGLVVKQTAFDDGLRLFLATGICGGFTTFSSFSVECLQMIQQQRYNSAIAYIAASTLAGIAAAYLGWTLTK
jgi:CrcB protein